MNNDNEKERAYLKEVAPTLFDQNGNPRHTAVDGSSAPEGYFASLPEKIMERITGEREPAATKRWSAYVNMQNLAIAAGVAILLSLIPIAKQLTSADQVSPTLQVSAPTAQEDALIFELVYEPWMEEKWYLEGAVLDGTLSYSLLDDIPEEALLAYLLDESHTLQATDEWLYY